MGGLEIPDGHNEEAEQCRQTYELRYADRVVVIYCLLAARHSSTHLGKDPDATSFAWSPDQQGWETR